jgi:transposase
MNAQGFSDFLKTLKSYQKDLSSVIVALESTGPYHLNLFSFLVSKGITTIVINPLIIANFSKLSLRKTKTDKCRELFRSDSGILMKMMKAVTGLCRPTMTGFIPLPMLAGLAMRKIFLL